VLVTGALIVEDEAAKHFLLSLLEELEPNLLRQCEVVVGGSDSAITGALTAMPPTQAWLTLVGVYDGDVGSRRDSLADLRWPFVFLPGDVSPELLLIGVVEHGTDLVNRVATETRRSEDSTRMAFQAAEGRDYHDYFAVFARAIGLDIRAVRRIFVRLWLEEPHNAASAKQLLHEIAKSVNS
jgi:hypothetical protein